MKKSTLVRIAITGLIVLLGSTAGAMAQTRDHLQCFKIKDALAKGKYTADLVTDTAMAIPAVETGCTVTVPPKLLCIDVAKQNVAPAPPGAAAGQAAQSYFCYKAKCTKADATISATDQFGAHSAKVTSTSLVCAPIPAGTGCDTGHTFCDGTCTDIMNDSDNCGACGTVCDAGSSCCSGVCKAVDTDTDNCGTCGNICASGSTCCTGTCSDLTSDPDNCNACGTACSPGQACAAGSCVTPGDCLASLGDPCTAGSDCCNNVCTSGVCDFASCVADGQACSMDSSCCSRNCSSGTCASLNPAAETLGNGCTQNTDCASVLCRSGKCAVSSYCQQDGDVCSDGSDCCSGSCSVSPGNTFGTCNSLSGPTSCSLHDGQVCGSSGIGACGAGCCSGLCAPYPTGVAICEPPSGCHATGDLCRQDSDCCGASGLPGSSGTPVTCNIAPSATIGTCRTPVGCKPDGELCKLSSSSCGVSCDCCSGNCGSQDTCHPDPAGTPRCSAPTCTAPGGACASSANCCNGTPCVPSGSGTYVCLGACAAAGQACSADGDCCTGTSCDRPQGSASGTCVSGASCAQVGQKCTVSGDCCNGVPCTCGEVACPPGDTSGTCHYAVQ